MTLLMLAAGRPMRYPIEQFARQHFAGTPRQSLLAALAETINTETLLEAIGSGIPAVQRVATHRLLALARNDDVQPVMLQALAGSVTSRIGMLTAMCFLPLSYQSTVVDAATEQLHHDDTEVQRAAARAIVFCFPDRVQDVVRVMQQLQSTELARLLCWSRSPELTPTVAAQLGYPARRLPPIIGLLVQPEWLADHWTRDSRLVEHLASECGYVEGACDERVRALWSRGVMFVGPCLADHPDIDEVRDRVIKFCFGLLPFSLQREHPATIDFDSSSPVDQELFLAAVREVDRSNLDELRVRDPFDYRTIESHRVLTCSHAHSRYVRRMFLESPRELALELSVPSQRLGRFLIEHACVALETNEEQREESELLLLARWRAASHARNPEDVLSSLVFPVRRVADFPLGFEHLLHAGAIHWENDRTLTPGTNAICRLAAAVGRLDLTDWLIEGERRWRGRLPPIGCELQIPRVDRSLSLLWKQLLRSLDIPSPRRPEYRQMVEAAFHPTASWHSMLAAPLLLRELGVIAVPQEMALHISIQGDLGDDARYLAFPHLFIRPSRTRRPRAAWTRVMSKGLVNCNADVETCLEESPAECRTEIRVFRCAAMEADGRTVLDAGYVDDIVAVHLLATAAMSENADLRSVFQNYASRIRASLTPFPAEFGELLDANFHESTGDPRDERFLDHLPILRLRERIAQSLREADLAGELERVLLEIRNNAVCAVLELLAVDKTEVREVWNPDAVPHACCPILN